MSKDDPISNEDTGLQPINPGEFEIRPVDTLSIEGYYEFYIFAEILVVDETIYRGSDPKKLVVGCPLEGVTFINNAILEMDMQMPGLEWPTDRAYEFIFPTTQLAYCVVVSNTIENVREDDIEVEYQWDTIWFDD